MSDRPFADRRKILDALPTLPPQSVRNGPNSASGPNSTSGPPSRKRTTSDEKDIRIDDMAADLSRCDNGGALDICCRELRDDMIATRAKLREVDSKLRDLIRQHEAIACGDHETRVKATMIRTTRMQEKERHSHRAPSGLPQHQQQQQDDYVSRYSSQKSKTTKKTKNTKTKTATKKADAHSSYSNEGVARGRSGGLIGRALARLAKLG